MRQNDIKLPSNKKFGLFFSFVFLATSTYLYINSFLLLSAVFVLLFSILILITFTKNILLSPLNKLWMTIGLFLGKIISPIILLIIYLFLFTPIAIIMNIIGRDELKLKQKNKKTSFWITRDEKKDNNFKLQF